MMRHVQWGRKFIYTVVFEEAYNLEASFYVRRVNRSKKNPIIAVFQVQLDLKKT